MAGDGAAGGSVGIAKRDVRPSRLSELATKAEAAATRSLDVATEWVTRVVLCACKFDLYVSYRQLLAHAL